MKVVPALVTLAILLPSPWFGDALVRGDGRNRRAASGPDLRIRCLQSRLSRRRLPHRLADLVGNGTDPVESAAHHRTGSVAGGGGLTMIPVLGWAIRLVLLAFGFGVVAARTIFGWTQDEVAQLRDETPADDPADPATA